MNRREFLARGARLAVAGLGSAAWGRAMTTETTTGPATVMTVRGPIAAAALGRTLAHEHVLVDFIGAAEVGPHRYAVEEVMAVALPHLRRARELGFAALVECTPAYLARDAVLLRRLSEKTGLHLVTNTGYYGARQNRFLPAHALVETAEQLAARWIAEAVDGIEGTGIRPGFIKCGVDPEPELSDMHRRLVEAAALTHRATGLTVAVHTGRGPGLAQLDILQAHGVAPEAFIWVHAQNALDDDVVAAAERGAWISLDGLRPAAITRHLHLCEVLRERGLLGRVLLSHDAGWFDPAKPGGGDFRGYELLAEGFVPLLRERGFGADAIERLLVANPASALTVRRRQWAGPA
jgi:phosphotriesterase-related protein